MMVAQASQRTGSAQFAGPTPREIVAIRYAQAMRHSRFVRFLRWAIPIGSAVVLIGIIAIAVFDPFRTISTGLSVASFNLSGSQITMQQPHLTGFRQDLRPYEVDADTALQDIKQPTIMNLSGLKAKIGLADRKSALMTALQGIYDSQKEFMTVDHPLRITSETYDVQMQSAKVDFKAGTVFTDQPVRVIMTGATIEADQMQVLDNGRQITFTGRVKTLMKSAQSASDKSETTQ